MFPTRWSHGLQHLRHKRRNVRFEGLRRVHTCLRQQDRTQRITGRNRWRFGWGWYHYPRTVPHVSETLRGQGAERRTLPLWGLGRVYSRRTQRAFGTAMCLCASLFRGVAAPLGRVIFSLLSKLRLVHTRLSEKNRAQGHTRRNRWRFGWGRYHYPRHELHVHEHPRAGCQNGKLCRFLALVGCVPEEHRKPAEQRCAYARRCSKASRPRWAA